MPKQNPIFLPVCLAVILALAIQVVVALVVLLCVDIGKRMLRSDRAYERLALLWDGTPVIVTYPAGQWSSRTYRALDGSPVGAAEIGSELPATTLLGMSLPTLFPARLPWSQRILGHSDGGEPPVYWYFVHDGYRAGSGYFVGFDSQSKHRVGYIGRSGFQSNLPTGRDRFRVAGHTYRGGLRTSVVSGSDLYFMPYWKVYVLSVNQLLEVDLRRRSVRTLIDADGMISIGVVRRALRPRGVQPAAEPLRPNWDPRYLAVRTARELIVLDPATGARHTYPIPQEIGRGSVGLYQLDDETALVEDSHQAGSAVDLYWIAPGGQVARHEHVQLQRPTSPFDNLDERVKSGLTGLLFPVPAVWSVAALASAPLAHITSDRAPGHPSALAESLAESWPALLVSVVLAAVATWFCLRWQRQYAMPWSRTWAAVVFVLGVPALLGYLLHRVWPARIGCPACKAAVPRDRDACPRCGAPFPEPEAKGIEVLA